MRSQTSSFVRATTVRSDQKRWLLPAADFRWHRNVGAEVTSTPVRKRCGVMEIRRLLHCILDDEITRSLKQHGDFIHALDRLDLCPGNR